MIFRIQAHLHRLRQHVRHYLSVALQKKIDTRGYYQPIQFLAAIAPMLSTLKCHRDYPLIKMKRTVVGVAFYGSLSKCTTH